jgi:hypothetical protein
MPWLHCTLSRFIYSMAGRADGTSFLILPAHTRSEYWMTLAMPEAIPMLFKAPSKRMSSCIDNDNETAQVHQTTLPAYSELDIKVIDVDAIGCENSVFWALAEPSSLAYSKAQSHHPSTCQPSTRNRAIPITGSSSY